MEKQNDQVDTIIYSIYVIVNNINNKLYIGCTEKPLNIRLKKHLDSVKYGSKQTIHQAIRKYGISNFDIRLIEDGFLSRQEMLKAEIDYIAYFNTYNGYGYNETIGGDGNSNKGVIRTEQWRKNISNGLKSHYEINESCRKGIPLTEEHKKAVSIGSMGKPGTNLGKTFNDEWRLKISKSLLGRECKSLRKFSDQQEKEICKLYVERNKSAYKIAKDLDCQRSIIYNILKRNNINIRDKTEIHNSRHIFTIEKEKEICNLYQIENITCYALSKKFKCHSTTIKRILLRHNIQL